MNPEDDEAPTSADSDDRGRETDDETDNGGDVARMYDRDGQVDPGDLSGPESSPGGAGEPELDAPIIDPGNDEPETVTGTFYVKYAEDSSVTLHDVDTAQICTLVENPGFERHEIVEGTLVSQPPMGVSYLVDELEAHYSIPVETSSEAPTKQVQEIAVEELDTGEAVAIEREGDGEIHILRVQPERTETTAEELRDDEMTYKNAARYDAVERVEIRIDDTEGVVSIRYLP